MVLMVQPLHSINREHETQRHQAACLRIHRESKTGIRTLISSLSANKCSGKLGLPQGFEHPALRKTPTAKANSITNPQGQRVWGQR